MPHPTLSLWIDSGEVDYLVQWMDEGLLPNFSRLRDEGFFARLDGFNSCLAEIAQAVSITGCGPETNHYWGTHWYEASTYSLSQRGGYDFQKREPFWALGPEHDIAVIDFPQYRMHENVYGIELVGWGSHAPMSEFASKPPEFAAEVKEKFGMHPTVGPDGESAVMEDAASMQKLFDRLLAGIPLRTELLKTVLKKREWNLVVACFAETHKGSHYFFPSEGNSHFTKPDDRFYHLREIYLAVDRAIGELLDLYGDRWNFLAYSLEGIGNNIEEPAGMFALPEIMLRDSFGAGAFEFEEEKRVVSPEREAGIYDWTMESWNLRRRTGKVATWLRDKFPLSRAISIERKLGIPPSPIHPLECDYLQYMPARWVKPYWPFMRAFALPTFSDGFIRINLQGREGNGKVPFDEYEQECDRILEMLSGIRHAETGEPLILDSQRTRTEPLASGLDLPYADLILTINNECPNAHFILDELGQIGPLPPIRAGSHTKRGFFLGKGPTIPKIDTPLNGKVLDFAPTILSLAGLKSTEPLDGSPLVEPKTRVAACICVRDEERFIRENLLYHHAIGVEKVYLFADRCQDTTIPIASALPFVEVIELDGEETGSFSYITDIHTRVMDKAMQFARQDGFGWLLTIDADELAYGDNLGLSENEWASVPVETLIEDASLCKMLDGIPEDILEIRLTTREIIPVLEWSDDPFYHQRFFYGPEEFERVLHHPVTGREERWSGFLGHVQGKSIIRTEARVRAHDSHRWAPEQAIEEGERPLFSRVAAIEKGWHAHYFLTSGNHLAEKGEKHSFQPEVWPCQTPVEKPIEIFKETARSGTKEQVEASATQHFLQPLEKLETVAKEREATLDPRIYRITEYVVQNFEPSTDETKSNTKNVSILSPENRNPLSYDPAEVPPSRLCGFYPVELYQNIPFRWMEPSASIQISVPPGTYIVTVGTIQGIDDQCQCLEELSINLGGNDLDDFEIDHQAGTLRVKVDIPESKEDYIKLELSVPEDAEFIIPSEERILAVPIRRLSFEPVHTA